jgi:hypothetical protein
MTTLLHYINSLLPVQVSTALGRKKNRNHKRDKENIITAVQKINAVLEAQGMMAVVVEINQDNKTQQS